MMYLYTGFFISKYNIDKSPEIIIIASTLNIIWMKRFKQKALRNIIEL
jgi:hypothetical protein